MNANVATTKEAGGMSEQPPATAAAEKRTVTWPAEPGSRAFVDIRTAAGVTIENFVQSVTLDEAQAAFNAMGKQGFVMTRVPTEDGSAEWYIRTEVAALRLRDNTRGIIAPTPNLVIP